MTERLNRLRVILDIVAALAIIAIGAVLVWRFLGVRPTAPPPPQAQSRQPAPVPTESLSIDTLIAQGNLTSKVLIIEYGDFECPACLAFATRTFSALIKKYVSTGQARFGFRHYPLPNHAMAMPTAISAQCAAEQDNFWEFYDRLFRRTTPLHDGLLVDTAKALRLNSGRFRECRNGASAATAVQRDLDEARRLGLRATPAFVVGFINEQEKVQPTAVLYGAQDLQRFDAAIAEAQTRR